MKSSKVATTARHMTTFGALTLLREDTLKPFQAGDIPIGARLVIDLRAPASYAGKRALLVTVQGPKDASSATAR